MGIGIWYLYRVAARISVPEGNLLCLFINFYFLSTEILKY